MACHPGKLHIPLDPCKTRDCVQDPRKYRHSFTLKISDLDKLEVVRADLRKFLESHPGVDRAQPLSVNLTNFSGSNFDIGIEARSMLAEAT